jgi:predicted transposase/invertase (TIGR01784 family)
MPFIIEKERDPLYKDGLQKGVEKGQKEREISIAKKMLKQDISVEMIVKLTGLLEKEVKKLKGAI